MQCTWNFTPLSVKRESQSSVANDLAVYCCMLLPVVLKMASPQQKSWYILCLMKNVTSVKHDFHTKVVFSQPVVVADFMLVNKL